MVTPEVAFFPEGMDSRSRNIRVKAGGLGDVSAALIQTLYEKEADIHVALPNYRTLFNGNLKNSSRDRLTALKTIMPQNRIHLAEDRAFFYQNAVYPGSSRDKIKNSLAFQRELMNYIIPNVQPDIIHCHDWMTGLIPGMAREYGIPCLFTIHNIHSMQCLLSEIEDMGIDAAGFWQQLYYVNMPGNYFETRESTPVDFLLSGIFASHFINTVSTSFLNELVDGRHDFVEEPLRMELKNKVKSGCATGITNGVDPSYNPEKDQTLFMKYGPSDHDNGKKINKRLLQKRIGLIEDENCPMFFWPSRLDPMQKGCQLLADILYHVVSRYWHQNLQIVFVADGEYQKNFRDIISFHDFGNRVAVCDFNEKLARIAYAASDFVLMPSRFEPCGLPQMIGPIYGTLPVAHNTGGIRDTVSNLNTVAGSGNGLLFETYDAGGLFWAIEQAMIFFNMPHQIKTKQISRIMKKSLASFSHDSTAEQYIDIYERMLRRPLFECDHNCAIETGDHLTPKKIAC